MVLNHCGVPMPLGNLVASSLLLVTTREYLRLRSEVRGFDLWCSRKRDEVPSETWSRRACSALPRESLLPRRFAGAGATATDPRASDRGLPEKTGLTARKSFASKETVIRRFGKVSPQWRGRSETSVERKSPPLKIKWLTRRCRFN